MGFREPPNTITLQFDKGHDLHGLEVTLRGMSIGEWMQATGMDGSDGDDNARTIDRFCDALVSWNLEDTDGRPVPVTEAQGRSHRMIMRLNNAYVEALTGVHNSDPLPASSTSGESYPELSAIPTEPLSGSLAS